MALTLVESESSWCFADVLHMWLAVCCTCHIYRCTRSNSGSNWVERECFYWALWARWIWSKPVWLYRDLSTQNLLCNSEFVNLASCYRPQDWTFCRDWFSRMSFKPVWLYIYIYVIIQSLQDIHLHLISSFSLGIKPRKPRHFKCCDLLSELQESFLKTKEEFWKQFFSIEWKSLEPKITLFSTDLYGQKPPRHFSK